MATKRNLAFNPEAMTGFRFVGYEEITQSDLLQERERTKEQDEFLKRLLTQELSIKLKDLQLQRKNKDNNIERQK